MAWLTYSINLIEPGHTLKQPCKVHSNGHGKVVAFVCCHQMDGIKTIWHGSFDTT